MNSYSKVKRIKISFNNNCLERKLYDVTLRDYYIYLMKRRRLFLVCNV